MELRVGGVGNHAVLLFCFCFSLAAGVTLGMSIIVGTGLWHGGMVACLIISMGAWVKLSSYLD